MQESSAALQEAAVVKAKDGEVVSQHKESHLQEDTKEVVLQQANCPLVSQEGPKEEVVLQQANCPLVSQEQKVEEVKEQKERKMEESKQVTEVEPEKEKETSSSSSSSSDEQEKRSLAEVETEMTEEDRREVQDHSKSVSEEKKEEQEAEDLLPPPPQEDFPPPPAEMMSSVEDLPPPVFDLPSPSEEILPPPVIPEFDNKKEELEVVGEIQNDLDDSNIKPSDDKKEIQKDVDHPPRSSYVSLVSPTGFAPSFPKSDSDKANETSVR